MKDAYSPIFQEYLNAFQVGYHQMAELQVVCPCCREPVFRAERDSAKGTTAYFSHYKSSDEFSVGECERRVEAIGSDEKERTNNEGRNQSLSIFRSVLREAVAPLRVNGKLLLESDQTWKASSMEVAALTRVLKSIIESHGKDELRKLTFYDSTDMLSVRGLHTNPNAQPSIRSGMAADLVITVFRDNAHRTASYLIGRSIQACYDRKSIDHAKMVGRARILQVAMNNQQKELAGDQISIAGYVLMDAMLRELERLPYEKMIRNAKKGLRPMQGVTVDDYLHEERYPELQYAARKVDEQKLAAFDEMFFRFRKESLLLSDYPSLYADTEKGNAITPEGEDNDEDNYPGMGM